MLEIFKKWYERYLFEEESVLLLVLIALAVVMLVTIGDILAPMLASIVLAYLMQGLAGKLQRWGMPSWLGVMIAYVVFVGAFFGFLLILLPLAWRQLMSFAGEMPRMVEQGVTLLQVLPQRYPELVSADQVQQVVSVAQKELAGLGQKLVTLSLASIPNVMAMMIYAILIPVLVFFFLKDRELILRWMSGFLPKERPLLRRIWSEMNIQIANYARGKVIEIILIGAASYLAFALLGLNYAALLGLLVGLSVIVPFIGAALVTIPVFVVALFQWGLGTEFYTVAVVYLVIQALDGNALVPLLFSEVVNLHPVAIIMAVLFFGGIWGIWGVFFAIPLATLVSAVITAWPSPRDSELST